MLESQRIHDKLTLSRRAKFSSLSWPTSPFMLDISAFFFRRHFFADFLFCINLQRDD